MSSRALQSVYLPYPAAGWMRRVSFHVQQVGKRLYFEPQVTWMTPKRQNNRNCTLHGVPSPEDQGWAEITRKPNPDVHPLSPSDGSSAHTHTHTHTPLHIHRQPLLPWAPDKKTQKGTLVRAKPLRLCHPRVWGKWYLIPVVQFERIRQN